MQTSRVPRKFTATMKAGIRIAAMLIALFLTGCASRPPLATVPSVDLKRYEGRWFEIAKYPNWFQRGCASDTVAQYSPLPDGAIQVVNRCKQADGQFREARAVATVVPGSGNAKLKVRFGRSPIAGDYWIIGLDEKNYSWSLIGDPWRQFLWILAREPRLDDATYESIVALAESQGYSRTRIERSIQNFQP
jgi:apolipoprotein D and lipocalin family protein